MAKNKGRKKNKVLPKNRVQNVTTFTLENNIKKNNLLNDIETKFLYDLEEKMSEVLLDFASPFLAGLDDPNDMEKAISFAASVWNLSLLPKDQQKDGIEEIAQIFGQGSVEHHNIGKYMVNKLLERKDIIYPNNRRCIVNYEFGVKNGLPWLNVASTI